MPVMHKLPRRGHRGFTLIEVLIAIVIFSIGLLGIAGLQIAGMRFTHGSSLRSVATLQAETMADLMRANEFGVRNGCYNVPSPGPTAFCNATSGVMPTTAPVNCATTVCTAGNRATYDLMIWHQNTAGAPLQALADVLPGGQGMVCRDSTPDDGDNTNWACDNLGNVIAIKIQWQERAVGEEDAGGSDVENKRFVMSVIPEINEF